MAQKRYATAQIIEIRVRLKSASAKVRPSAREQSYYRWRRDYGDLKLDQAKRASMHCARRSASSSSSGF